MNSSFFKNLDQTIGENLRATRTRPDIQGMLSSLPPMNTSRSSITSSDLSMSMDDPIEGLNAMIDDEEISTTFHDPLDDLFQDEDILEAINPNLRLPRPQMDSKPTGLFSVSLSH